MSSRPHRQVGVTERGATPALADVDIPREHRGALHFNEYPGTLLSCGINPNSEPGMAAVFAPLPRLQAMGDESAVSSPARDRALLEAVRRAHLGILEISRLPRAGIAECLDKAFAACTQSSDNSLALRIRRAFEAERYFRAPPDRLSSGERQLAGDLPGLRNGALMALEALSRRPEEEWNRKEVGNIQLARLAFPQLFEVHDSGKKAAIISPQALPPWCVDFFGKPRIASIHFSREKHARRSHLVDLMVDGQQLPITIGCAEVSDLEKVWEVFGSKAVMTACGECARDKGLCAILVGVHEDLRQRHADLEATRAPAALDNTKVTTRDGSVVDIALEVNTLKVVHELAASPRMPVGMLKSEFLLEEQSGNVRNIWELSVKEMAAFYERFLRAAGRRPVTFRLADEIRSDSLDSFKPIIPLTLREKFRHDQIEAITRAARHTGRAVTIMLPQFESVDRYQEVVAIADRTLRNKRDGKAGPPLIQVMPLIESLEGIDALEDLLHFGKRVAAIGIGVVDLTQKAASADSRDDPGLDNPTSEVAVAFERIVSLGRGYEVPVVACGRRTGEPNLLALCYSVGVTSFVVQPGMYRAAAAQIAAFHADECVRMLDELERARPDQRADIYRRFFAAVQV